MPASYRPGTWGKTLRRTFTAALAALSLSLPLLACSPTFAADDGPAATASTAEASTEVPAEVATEHVLDEAAEALAGGDPTGQEADEESPTLALRDLRVALPHLGPGQRKRAHGLLARPTHGADDPYGDGYTVPSRRTCTTTICVHWVERTGDAPPSSRWVERSLRVLQRTWAVEVGELGFRRPVRDGRRGGDDRLDVYLKDVGSKGYYGYCAPERRQTGEKWIVSGYCVLDDDFARSQFDARPIDSLRVTAAHEFFHAVQFAYDYAEDPWLMEGTATWMEERVADDVDDNRRYLEYGQLAQPGEPLDVFRPNGFDQYGNWAFFEYLSQRFGRGVVRRIWTHASGEWRNHSLTAVKAALPEGTSFADVFRDYAAGNTVPARTYTEGSSWPHPTVDARHTLGVVAATAAGRLRISHLASRNVSVRPGDTLSGGGWRARVSIDGPLRRTSPTARVLIHRRGGTLVRKVVTLDAAGDGSTSFDFGSGEVSRATITLANASTRYDCWERTTYACQGVARDDGRTYRYRVQVFRR